MTIYVGFKHVFMFDQIFNMIQPYVQPISTMFGISWDGPHDIPSPLAPGEGSDLRQGAARRPMRGIAHRTRRHDPNGGFMALGCTHYIYIHLYIYTHIITYNYDQWHIYIYIFGFLFGIFPL